MIRKTDYANEVSFVTKEQMKSVLKKILGK
ncbi:hypothetical protein J2T12_003372 [Paenibacillus anaericanus]|nr:hypothetical protein [Paenibacillus anaericanus]